MDIRRQVGLNVLRIRRERGWSQEALAFKAEIHRTYVSGVERGVRNPTITVLAELAASAAVAAAPSYPVLVGRGLNGCSWP